MINKFNGLYEYKGFLIYNGSNNHEWDIEPLNKSIEEIELFKASSPCFKTIDKAKKWIDNNQSENLCRRN